MLPGGQYSQTNREPPTPFLPSQAKAAQPTDCVVFQTSCVKWPVSSVKPVTGSALPEDEDEEGEPKLYRARSLPQASTADVMSG